jgi:hypothetical protein
LHQLAQLNQTSSIALLPVINFETAGSGLLKHALKRRKEWTSFDYKKEGEVLLQKNIT